MWEQNSSESDSYNSHFPSLSSSPISQFFFSFRLHLFSLCCSSPISMQFHHHHPLLESACAMWRMPPLFLMMFLYEYAKTFTHIRTHKDRHTILDRRRLKILFSRIWIVWIAEWNSWRLRIVLLDALVSVNFIVLWGICQRMPLFLKSMAMKLFVVLVSPFIISFYLHFCWMFIELNLVVAWRCEIIGCFKRSSSILVGMWRCKEESDCIKRIFTLWFGFKLGKNTWGWPFI